MKKLQSTQRRMMRMIVQTNRKTKKHPAAAHAESVDEVAEDEPHDPDCKMKEDTTEANPQDPNEQEESDRDADSNPSFDRMQQDELEDVQETWVDNMVRATHKADDRLAANGIMS